MRKIAEWPAQVDTRAQALSRRLAGEIRLTSLTRDTATLDFSAVVAAHLGISLRWPEAKRRLGACLHGVVSREWIDGEDRLWVAYRDRPLDWEVVRDRCGQALVLPATRPLTPRLIVDALAITSTERVRWTKDGRMPRSGSVTIRRAHPVSVGTYAVATIAHLVANPQIIAAWRSADTRKGAGYATG